MKAITCNLKKDFLDYMLYNIIHSKHYTILEIGFGVFILSLYKCSKYVFGNDKSVKSKGKNENKILSFYK
ncbi:hypothetical protein JSCD14_11660 [Clostridioides difficile]|nr:hypothetical protein TNHP173_25340 [Clostridioides difficile]GMK62800.1 hypothetical protein JSCD1_26920 [Clostridioides difficile]GMK65280.1 hypothetical protein JSCD2_16110 [Clostridioides difficile]GMK68740.1 hypothetical protein JSCD3_15340 [Clostridioides difficile]GMK73233.1 hypothetical protein JSCD4_24040 [Clostridioides difficile]